MGAGSFQKVMINAGLVAGLMSGGSALADDVMTIRGRAIFKGDTANYDPKPIGAVKGTQCAQMGQILSSSVLVNKHTSPPTLRNVIVWLVEGPVDMRGMAPTKSLVIEMVGCRFEPRITMAYARQRVRVQNGDSFPQTFRTLSKKNRPQAVTIPRPNMPISLSFSDAEEPFQIKSPDYPWMIGWIAVFDQPYFLMTDDRGTFEFKDFPAGRYTFKAWHEVFGTKTIKIDVSPGKANIIDFVFEADKEPTPKTKTD